MMLATQNGAVELYHDNSKKLETTADGVTVTSTADNGPILKLVSDDHSDVADFNIEGAIQFFADNDADQSVRYSQIMNVTADVTDGTENGALYYSLTVNGQPHPRLTAPSRCRMQLAQCNLRMVAAQV
jgi:hypothetical protein